MAGAHRTLEAIRAGVPRQTARLSPGAPVVAIHSVAWDRQHRPFDCYLAWLRTDRLTIEIGVGASPETLHTRLGTPQVRDTYVQIGRWPIAPADDSPTPYPQSLSAKPHSPSCSSRGRKQARRRKAQLRDTLMPSFRTRLLSVRPPSLLRASQFRIAIARSARRFRPAWLYAG